VSYIRLENCRNEVRVAFLLGKARVVPLKSITIPRLELTAAVVAARVDVMLKSELQLELDESLFGRIVLQYLSILTTKTNDFKPLWQTEFLP